MFKDEADGKQIDEFVGLRAPTKCLMALNITNVRGDKECYKNEYSIRLLTRVLI